MKETIEETIRKRCKENAQLICDESKGAYPHAGGIEDLLYSLVKGLIKEALSSGPSEDCPFCGDKPMMQTHYDNDGSDCTWRYMECRKCGARTRGKWFSGTNDCPNFYEEVRDEWTRRANTQLAATPNLDDKELEDAANEAFPTLDNESREQAKYIWKAGYRFALGNK